MNLRREILGEPLYSRGVESLGKPVHQSMIGRWIINFIAASSDSRRRTARGLLIRSRSANAFTRPRSICAASGR